MRRHRTKEEEGGSLQCAGGMRCVTVGRTERRSPAATWIHQILSQFSHFVSFTKKEKKMAQSLVSFLIDFFGIRREAGPRPGEVGAEGIHQKSTY